MTSLLFGAPTCSGVNEYRPVCQGVEYTFACLEGDRGRSVLRLRDTKQIFEDLTYRVESELPPKQYMATTSPSGDTHDWEILATPGDTIRFSMTGTEKDGETPSLILECYAQNNTCIAPMCPVTDPVFQNEEYLSPSGHFYMYPHRNTLPAELAVLHLVCILAVALIFLGVILRWTRLRTCQNKCGSCN